MNCLFETHLECSCWYINCNNMRADKRKSLSKVATVVLQDPLLNQREIAQKAWVWLWTANRAILEMEQNGTKSPDIIAITDTDLENVRTMQDIIRRKLQESETYETTRLVEFAQVMKEATTRYSLFRWTVTDRNGGLKSAVAEMSDDELIKLSNGDQ